MSKSETTSASNWNVIKDGEAGRRGARWEEVRFELFPKNFYLFLGPFQLQARSSVV